MSAVEQALSVLGPLARRDVPLGALTTYRVGGSAAIMVEADDGHALARVHEAVAASGLPVLVVGNGSNMLVADEGFPGIALRLGAEFEEVDLTRPVVRAGGAALLPVIARRTASAGLRGFEWAVGVPGSVGGAVRMNAGGHGSDMAAALGRVRVFDLQTGDDDVVDATALGLGYRQSSIHSHQVVMWAELRLHPGSSVDAEAEISEIVRWRRENQPGGANAGSVFRNPAGDAAGRLIDAAGLRGLRLGTAEVSTKHANFIQSDDGGSANDVRALMVEVARRVHEYAGVDLVAETRLVGFDERVDDGRGGPSDG